MDVLQPFVPLGNSGTVPRGQRLESPLVCLRGGGDEFYSLFILSFCNKKGPPAGGWWLVTKTSEYGILGVGEGGC